MAHILESIKTKYTAAREQEQKKNIEQTIKHSEAIKYARKKIMELLIKGLDKIEKEDDPNYYVTNAESGKIRIYIMSFPPIFLLETGEEYALEFIIGNTGEYGATVYDMFYEHFNTDLIVESCDDEIAFYVEY